MYQTYTVTYVYPHATLDRRTIKIFAPSESDARASARDSEGSNIKIISVTSGKRNATRGRNHKERSGRGTSGMHLAHILNGWVFIFGSKLETAQPIALDGEDMFYRNRSEAVTAAKRHGLKVSKTGVTSAHGPNPYA